MVRNKILRASAIVAATAGLMLNVADVAGASPSTGVISTTGFDSLNKVISKADNNVLTTRQTDVSLGNFSAQDAQSGRVSDSFNTRGGGAAISGDAMNRSSIGTNVSVMAAPSTVSAPSMSSDPTGGVGQVDTTGAGSSNLVLSDNSNKVVDKSVTDVTNLNFSAQSARSGDVSSDFNTIGGNAESGAAFNSNMTSTTVTVSQ